VSREDFRRELGNAFDAISGSPNPALSDRVRAALGEAPERRGPIWIAGLAAAVIAVILVGVLVVANPLKRPSFVSPGGGPSPSAAATPSGAASPSPSPSATLAPFECGTTLQFTGATPPTTTYVDDVRTGSHAGYDRLTIQFNNGQPDSIDVKAQAGTTFTQGGGGQPVTLLGSSGLLITIHSVDAHTFYSGPTDFKTGYPVMLEARQVEDFEGYVRWGLGLSKTACYRAFILTNPTRLVVDIQTP
jgi:hypothetical protein